MPACVAAIVATLMRQPMELPEVSAEVPAGKYEQAFRQLALSWYCAFTPVQLATIAVQ
jgi:hypothetical protein